MVEVDRPTYSYVFLRVRSLDSWGVVDGGRVIISTQRVFAVPSGKTASKTTQQAIKKDRLQTFLQHGIPIFQGRS